MDANNSSELVKSEQRHAAAVRAANDGLWDWNIKTNEVYFSPRWQHMLGYTEHDELSHHFDTFFDLLHLDDRERVLTLAQKYIKGERDSFGVEFSMRHKSGHYIRILSRGYLIRDKNDGAPLHLIGTHADITQQKRNEQFILDTSEILRMIALKEPKEEIYDAIAHLYESRHPGMRCSMLILEGNKLLHAGAPSMPQEYCDAVHGLENGPGVGSCGTATYHGKRVIVENIETDPKWAKIKQFALPHGMQCCWSEPIKNSRGTVLGAFGMYYDYPATPTEAEANDLSSAARLASIIMEREKSEQELYQHRKHLEELVSERTRQFEEARLEAEAANEAKSNFLANMSHEIRTPMNALLGLSQLALQTDLNPKQQDYLEKIHTSTTSLIGVINDILDFSKIEAGMLDIDQIPFNIIETVEQAADIFTQSVQDKNLRLTIDIQPDTHPYLLGDPLRLRQIFTNLIGNAIKFTEKGGIDITIRQLPASSDKTKILQVAVADTGIGMTPDQIERVFDAFDQGDSSTTREYGGTGLGLTITRQLINLMNGEIRVDSAIDEGSVFTFTLSFTIDSAKPQKKVVPSNKLPDLSNKHILLVEDNPINQQVATEMLKLSKCTVKPAVNGEEAVQKIASGHQFDLILMDIQMPVMNGIDATIKIRELESGSKRTPIIAVTGAALKAERVLALESGMDALITKPFSLETLFQELARWV